MERFSYSRWHMSVSHCIFYNYHSHRFSFSHMNTLSPSFSLLRAVSPPGLQLAGTHSCSPASLSDCLASSRLQHRLELAVHANLLLFLTDDALDGGRQASGAPGKDKSVAVLAAAVLFQSAAGVGDGIVVIVGVNHPVVVTWLDKKRNRVRSNKQLIWTGNVYWTYLHWRGSWPGPGSSWTFFQECWRLGQSTGQPYQHTRPRSCKMVVQAHIYKVQHVTQCTFFCNEAKNFCLVLHKPGKPCLYSWWCSSGGSHLKI